MSLPPDGVVDVSPSCTFLAVGSGNARSQQTVTVTTFDPQGESIEGLRLRIAVGDEPSTLPDASLETSAIDAWSPDSDVDAAPAAASSTCGGAGRAPPSVWPQVSLTSGGPECLQRSTSFLDCLVPASGVFTFTVSAAGPDSSSAYVPVWICTLDRCELLSVVLGVGGANGVLSIVPLPSSTAGVPSGSCEQDLASQCDVRALRYQLVLLGAAPSMAPSGATASPADAGDVTASADAGDSTLPPAPAIVTPVALVANVTASVTGSTPVSVTTAESCSGVATGSASTDVSFAPESTSSQPFTVCAPPGVTFTLSAVDLANASRSGTTSGSWGNAMTLRSAEVDPQGMILTVSFCNGSAYTGTAIPGLGADFTLSPPATLDANTGAVRLPSAGTLDASAGPDANVSDGAPSDGASEGASMPTPAPSAEGGASSVATLEYLPTLQECTLTIPTGGAP